MNYVDALTGNLILNLSIAAWAIAQVLKAIIIFITEHRIDITRIWGGGGMPSSHSAFVCACAAAIVLGFGREAAERGLAEFHGAGRRFEYKGDYHGARVYDDYAHHPGELHALLEAVKGLGYRRIICAFQPHTYTRTLALFDDFVRELKGADVAVLAEIYAAREKNETGLSSRRLAEQIPGAQYCATLEEVTDLLARLAEPGDLILTVGAGDIHTAGEALVARGVEGR